MLKKAHKKRLRINEEDHTVNLGEKPITHHKQEARYVDVSLCIWT